MRCHTDGRSARGSPPGLSEEAKVKGGLRTGDVTMSTAGDFSRGSSRGVTRFALPFPTAAKRVAAKVVKRRRVKPRAKPRRKRAAPKRR